MTLDLLKSNIEREKAIVLELSIFSRQLEQFNRLGDEESFMDRKLLRGAVEGLVSQLEIVNTAIPELINNIQFYKKLGDEETGRNEKKAGNLLKVSYNHPEEKSKKIEIAIKKQDKGKFLSGISLSKFAIAKMRKGEIDKSGKKRLQTESREATLQQFSYYIRISNKFFRNLADKLIEKKYFDGLNRDLRKITSPFIIQSYVSMMFLSTALAFIAGFLLAVVFAVFKLYALAAGIFFAAPLVAFLMFFSYPSAQRKTLEKEINQELPFVAIYMGAVATSGIEPSKIFEIIIRTRDYPFTQRELKKLLNYVNFYGYDLVSALRQSSKTSPSERLSVLLNGLATTISSGGELTQFLDKHAESLLFDYRLEREKYTKVAETFMDIYISIVIAAPMIMMILFVLISLTGYASSIFTPSMLSILIIFVVSALNIGFLLFLNTKQPKF